VLIFLAKPLFLLTPFLLALTILGTYFIIKGSTKEVIIQTVINKNIDEEQKNIKDRLSRLSSIEKTVLQRIAENTGKIFQADLAKDLDLPHYKITRILSKFERLGLVTREQAGMTNLVCLIFNPKEISDL
jgi:uncharacterized membrane protein